MISQVAAALEDIDGTEAEKAVIEERYRQVSWHKGVRMDRPTDN